MSKSKDFEILNFTEEIDPEIRDQVDDEHWDFIQNALIDRRVMIDEKIREFLGEFLDELFPESPADYSLQQQQQAMQFVGESISRAAFGLFRCSGIPWPILRKVLAMQALQYEIEDTKYIMEDGTDFTQDEADEQETRH